MRVRFFALIMVLVLLLTGCSRMLETDYRMVSAHTESTPEMLSDSDTLVASTYNELKNAILRMVRTGNTEGVVRLRNYVGDVDSDVQNACTAVYKGEPIGVYALDYLSHTLTPLLTDYDVRLRLTYRRTVEQIQAVEYVTGPSAFRERFSELLYDFGTELTVETNYFQESEYDFQAILNKLYYDNPLYAQGFPELSYNLYPDTDLRRIIELTLYYPDTLYELRSRVSQCEDAVLGVTRALPAGLTELETALALYEALAAMSDFDWELYGSVSDSRQAHSSVYDALCGGRSLSEGYALAYKALCDQAGIECRVVRGQYSRVTEMAMETNEHYWNLINLDGSWYHVDLSVDKMNDSLTYRTFLLDDSLMSLEYRWDTSSLPPADGELVYQPPEMTDDDEKTVSRPRGDTGDAPPEDDDTADSVEDDVPVEESEPEDG